MDQQLKKAYILRRKAYRETSYLLDCFSYDYGIISLVFRGAKNLRHPSKSHWASPFNLLVINFNPKKQGLSALNHYEIISQYELKDWWLYCGFYLNEILLKLLTHFDPHSQLFDHYHNLIDQLNTCPDKLTTQWLLRYFEIKLLQELGYGMNFLYDANQIKIEKESNYQFSIHHGFIKYQPSHLADFYIQGEILLTLKQLEDSGPSVLSQKQINEHLIQSSRLLKNMINHLLSYQTLESRELLKEYLSI